MWDMSKNRGSHVIGAAFVVLTLILAGCAAKTDRVDAYNAYALDAAQMGLWQEAALRWEQALTRRPKDARVLNNLGVAYEAKGRFDEALKVYREAVALEPSNADYRRNLRRCERNQKRSSQVPGDLPDETKPTDDDSQRNQRTLRDENDDE